MLDDDYIHRRKKPKLLLCNHILKGYSILPPSLFTPPPQHNPPLTLYHPTCRLTAHLSSVVPLWNRLPMDIMPPVCTLSRRRYSLLISFNFSIAIYVGACTLFFVCLVSVFSLFVLGSHYISHMVRWLHPWCCTELV